MPGGVGAVAAAAVAAVPGVVCVATDSSTDAWPAAKLPFPVPASLFSFLCPLQSQIPIFPSSHFPVACQITLQSWEGWSTSERRIQRIYTDTHTHKHTHLYMYMCACIVCAVFMRLMTDSLHFRGTFVSLCPVASPAQPCPASVFIFVYKHNEIASGRRCDACHGHYSIYTRLPKSLPLPLLPSLAYPASSLSSIAVSLDKRLSN